MINIFSVKNSASNYNWNFPAKLFLIFLFTCNNIPDFLVKIHVFPVRQLIPGKSQMTSRLRSFHYDQICSPVISMCPHFQNQVCRPFRRNNRRNLCSAKLRYQLRQIHGKPGTADDQICAACHCLLYMLFIMLQRYHNINTDQPFSHGDLPCLPYMLSYCLQIASRLVFLKACLVISDLSRGNHSYSSFCCHRTSQRTPAHSHSHSPLNNRKFCHHISNFQTSQTAFISSIQNNILHALI